MSRNSSLERLQKSCIEGIKEILKFFRKDNKVVHEDFKESLSSKEEELDVNFAEGTTYDYELIAFMKNKLELLNVEKENGNYTYTPTEEGYRLAKHVNHDKLFRLELGKYIYAKSASNFNYFHRVVETLLKPAIDSGKTEIEWREYKEEINRRSNGPSGQSIRCILEGLYIVKKKEGKVLLNLDKAEKMFKIDVLENIIDSELREENNELKKSILKERVEEYGYKDYEIDDKLQEMAENGKVRVFGTGAGKNAVEEVRRLKK